MTKQTEKLLVVVPYRDRESHLAEFIPHINSILDQQNIDHKIIVIEQSWHKEFNRGLTSNIGFSLFHNDFDYVCIHDVDMMGEDFDYSYESDKVVHLSFSRRIDTGYQDCYDRYLGGVVLFSKQDYLKINGFSNNYWGWGCEDDDLRLRCDTFNLSVVQRKCKFYTLPHPSSAYRTPQYMKNYEFMVEHFRTPHEDRIKLFQNDGVNQCSNYFHLNSCMDQEGFTTVKVEIK